MSNIPDIGVVFDTNISLSASDTDVELGETVTFKGILYAYFVNESSGNLDFCNTFDDVSLDVYVDNTLTDTVTTDIYGEFSFDVAFEDDGTHRVRVVCSDGTNYTGCRSSIINVSVGSLTVSLSINPRTITFGNSTIMTATVLDAGEPVSGVDVTFDISSWGRTTETTNSSGIAQLTVWGLAAGVHNVTAEYGGAVSSSVSVTVNKFTPTVTINAPASGTVGTSFTVEGTVNVGLTSSVKLYENNVLLETLTVQGGVFSTSLTKSSAGTYSYYVVFEETSNYNSVTSSTVSVVVSDVAPSYEGINVSSSADILSYYDEDSCTITAQLVDVNDDPVSVSGVSITLSKDGVVWDTIQTDNTGQVTKTYQSTGVGDVEFEATDGTLVSEIFSVEDCIFYHGDAISYTGTSTSDTVYSLGYDEIADLSSTNFEFTWKFHQTQRGADVCLGASSEFSVSPVKSNYRVYIGGNDSGVGRYGYRTTSSSTSTSGTVSANTVYNMKITRNSNTFNYYLNDNLLGTKTASFFSNYNMFGIHTVQWNRGTTTISEIKIKPL